MKNLLFVVFVLFSTALAGQDYALYESHYLTPKPGHQAALMEEIAEHNRLYHAEGPYANFMSQVIAGPNSGDIVFAMGPCTFTLLDDRPSSPEHNWDWAGVMAHTQSLSDVYFWRRNDEISYIPEGASDGPPNMIRVRFFEVADNDLFVKVQGQIAATLKAVGSTRSRIMYQRQFAHSDKKDWVFVQPYESWSELDEPGPGNFQETFESIHGAGSFEVFQKEIGEAIISRDDEWRVVLTGLMGTGDN